MTSPPSPGEVLIGFSVSRRWSAFTHRLTRQSASHVWLLHHDQDFGLNMVIEIHLGGFRLLPLEVFAWKHKILAVVRPGHSILAGLHTLGRSIEQVSWNTRCFRWLACKWAHPLTPALGTLGAETLVMVLRASNYPGVDLPAAAVPQDLLSFFIREGSVCALI